MAKFCSILLCLTAVFCITLAEVPQGDKKILCYYNNVAKYRLGDGKYVVDTIPEVCTHIIYSFVRLDGEIGIFPSDPAADEENIKQLVELKKKHPGKKIMVSITKKSGEFWLDIANTEEKRQTLNKNLIHFIRFFGIDGIDIDIHGFGFGNNAEFYDKEAYRVLCKSFREAIEEESKETGYNKILFSVVLPEYFNFKFEVDHIVDYVDWISVTEHFEDPTEKLHVHHISPLYNNEGSSVNETINYYLNNGATADKIVMAIPLFANSFKLLDSEKHQIKSEAVALGDEGKYTLVKGNLAYFELCKMLKDEEWTVENQNEGFGPYAYKDNQWVSYDDENMVRTKAEYAKKMGLQGLMFLTMDLDDFSGYCHGVKFPLLQAGAETFLKN